VGWGRHPNTLFPASAKPSSGKKVFFDGRMARERTREVGARHATLAPASGLLAFVGRVRVQPPACARVADDSPSGPENIPLFAGRFILWRY
jgi:hypothetical protein